MAQQYGRRMLNYTCCLSEHQQRWEFHWQAKEVTLDNFCAIYMINSFWHFISWQHHSSPVMTLWKPVEQMLGNAKRIPSNKVTLSGFRFVYRARGTQRRWDVFMPSVSWRIGKQVPSAVQKRRQRTLHERHGLSFNIEEMASAKSLVCFLLKFASSYSEVLSSTKGLRRFFAVEGASASVS
jgi:hypothetical protein